MKRKTKKFNKLSDKFGSLKNLRFRQSIFGKLFLFYLILMILVLSISGVVNSVVSMNESKAQFESSTKQFLKAKKETVDNITSSISKIAVQLMINDKVTTLLKTSKTDLFHAPQAAKEVTAQLDAISYSNEYLHSIYINNPNGITAPSTALSLINDGGKAIQDKDFYKNAINGPVEGKWYNFLNGELSFLTTDKFISFVKELKDMNGRSLGLLMVNLSPTSFNKLVEGTQIGKKGYLFILDQNGVMLANPNTNLLGTSLGKTGIMKPVYQKANGTFQYKDPKTGVMMFGVFNTASEIGWKYVAVVPKTELTQSANKVILFTILISILCLILTIIVSFIISNGIVVPLRKILDAIKAVGDGNLTIRVNHKSKDEFGELGKDFNHMVEKLKLLISDVKGTVQNTNEAAETITAEADSLTEFSSSISSAMEEIASGSEIQAEKAQKSVTKMGSFSDEIGDLIHSSSEVNDAAKKAELMANNGMNSVKELQRSSEESMQTLHQITGAILGLSENTKEISGILDSISAISEQTNLLALNAAIEAARAGEFGKGFAVVADEVRKLAEDSKRSAMSIGAIIGSFKTKTQESVEMSNIITATLSGQVKQVEGTIHSFESIKNSVEVVGNKIILFNDKLEHLEESKSDIVTTIHEIADISANSAAAIQNAGAAIDSAAASTKEMNSLSAELYETSKGLKHLTDNFILE
jgi:methyl-accepting chemotaxis protein